MAEHTFTSHPAAAYTVKDGDVVVHRQITPRWIKGEEVALNGAAAITREDMARALANAYAMGVEDTKAAFREFIGARGM